MGSGRGLLALGVWAAAALPACAQGYLVGPGYGFTYTRQTRHSLFSLSVGGFTGPSYASNGAVLVGSIGGYPGPVFVPQPVVVVQAAPAAVVVAQRPGVVVDQLALDVLPREFLQARGVRLPPERPPEPRAEVVPPPRQRAPAPPPAELPRPQPPLDDPKAEHARLVDTGRQAFVLGEYGRAADRFRQATRLVPAAPTAHFLLAQAHFAQGKYPEAVDAVAAGLALRPDWPTDPAFLPRDLYGPNVADLNDQRRRLDDALKRLPDDPFLLFLSAYHLWFDGQRDEARARFRRAAAAGADRNACDCFLRAVPPPIVAVR